MTMPQLETPKPKNKMKTFNWSKLPVNKIFGKNNIWTKVAKTFEKDKESPIGEVLLFKSVIYSVLFYILFCDIATNLANFTYTLFLVRYS